MQKEVDLKELRLGDKFYVEPTEDPNDRIPVKIRGMMSWGLVHGQVDVPCRRLDNDEDVMVAIDFNARVTIVPEDALDERKSFQDGSETSS